MGKLWVHTWYAIIKYLSLEKVSSTKGKPSQLSGLTLWFHPTTLSLSQRLMRKIFRTPLRKAQGPSQNYIRSLHPKWERQQLFRSNFPPRIAIILFHKSFIPSDEKATKMSYDIDTSPRRKEKKAAHRFIGTQMLCLRLKESIEAASFCPVGRTHSDPLQRLLITLEFESHSFARLIYHPSQIHIANMECLTWELNRIFMGGLTRWFSYPIFFVCVIQWMFANIVRFEIFIYDCEIPARCLDR